MDHMLYWISLISLVISAISFLLFVVFILRPPKKGETSFGEARQQGEVEGLAKIAEAIAKLVDSFGKAGPLALCLTSSIVFMVISLIAARL
jgi:hypothetical protein